MEKKFDFNGLTTDEVIASKEKYGNNAIVYPKENTFLKGLLEFAKDPMIILLLVASIIYFVSGKTADAFFLTSAILLITFISSYQNTRSRNALQKLKKFTKPNCTVIRNNIKQEIKTDNLVIGDYLVLEEGTTISADGKIIHSNDFSVNESILTGESVSVNKNKASPNPFVYQGTTVTTGLAIVIINAIGNTTQLGKIGKSLQNIPEEKTPLEIQIDHFVKKMALAGTLVFIIVWGLNFYHSHNILESLLQSLTLAMSILPEEIPIAFTTFMALGAWRMMQQGIIVKQMKTVETLGSATVICIDKTGTITQNTMSFAKLFTVQSNKITDVTDVLDNDEKEVIATAMWASEPIPFDPMEIALHNAYTKSTKKDERHKYKMIHEYALSGKPPMMTHIFENGTTQIIASKGAPEALLPICNLSDIEKTQIHKAIKKLTSQGYRILAVAKAIFEGKNYPKTQQNFQFEFKGLLAFYDPPKNNINRVLQHFYKAGIGVKIITGDNALTTSAIAKQIGFIGFEKSISGDELMILSDKELQQKVGEINLFTRMYPEAKLKIINALKANNEIVAMTGDGVNDGPALKAAHIGIAMGKKGTEIAKQAASLILINDDLAKMVNAIAMGRKIYTNLKKAIQFIISIHIPIILTVFIPLALGWKYPTIFSPIHIIFLELIMGPTCSIVYENEPLEKNTMTQKPRSFTTTFFNWKELSTSILQGVMITIGSLLMYQYSVYLQYDEALCRTIVFIVLVTANVFLTLVNRSFYYSIFSTLSYKNNLVGFIILITISSTALLLYVPFLARFFDFEQLTFKQLVISIGVGSLSVLWYEGIKLFKRVTTTKAN
ncbi:MAG: cation-translocating P-type ATPase [Limnohabitans sp.]|nr:cation-translocating P-type ATPase [Limnohabitans sp.]